MAIPSFGYIFVLERGSIPRDLTGRVFRSGQSGAARRKNAVFAEAWAKHHGHFGQPSGFLGAVSIACEAELDRVAKQRKLLEEMRDKGEVPRRNAAKPAPDGN
jgi:hypothetical protein